MNRAMPVLIASVVGIVLLTMSTFTVSETEYAIKFRLKDIVAADYKPGLHFKIPLLETVSKFENRVLTKTFPAEQFLTSEGKILSIDFFMKWQIVDVSRFYQATGADIDVAAIRLGATVKDGLKGLIARNTLQQTVQRAEFIDELRKGAEANAAQLGMKLVDVRVKQIDLPKEVGESVFNRMRQDFKQQAAKLRAEGSQELETLRAEADRLRTEILANGYREAEKIRGEGDAKAAEIYAKAYGRNPEFYAFYRSMQAYREALGRDSDVMVISPDSDFFKYLKQPNAR